VQTIVRDVAWHPDLPLIAATSWNGASTLYTYDDDIRQEQLQRSSAAANPKQTQPDE